jgi:hypothetical protein|tara:strand:+ start:143 stop:310 length:168 start_codon:yes stop_codon:yes gene_type:complete
MAKQVTMKKGEDIIKCSDDHIEHFQSIGFTLTGEKKVAKKSEKVVKQDKEEDNKK